VLAAGDRRMHEAALALLERDDSRLGSLSS